MRTAKKRSAKKTARGDGGQVATLAPPQETGEPSVAYWDLIQEFHEIARHAKANGAPPVLLDAIHDVGNPDVNIDSRPAESDLANVVRTFWSLPDSERTRIFNGWKWQRPEDRDAIAARETGKTHGLLSFLTLADHRKPDAAPMAFFEEIPTENACSVRLHIRIGTSQAEVKAAIERFHEAVCSDWETLITDPDRFALSPRQEARAAEPSPAAPIARGVTLADIDRFCVQISDLSERLGFTTASFEDGLLMPDLTVREVYQVNSDNEALFMLIGPERKAGEEEQDEQQEAKK